MAFLRLSGLLTSITGKLNGSYFSQKKGGTTMNRCGGKLTKADSGRASSQLARNKLADIARGWQLLTDGQRLSWQNFGSTLTWKNKANFDYTPSGYEVYMSCNLNLINIGRPVLLEPVLSVGDGVLDALRITFTVTGALQCNYGLPNTTNNGIIIMASAPCSAGVKYPKGGYKTIFAADQIESGDTILTTSYQSVFGYLPTVGVIFFKIIIVVKDSGIQNGSKLTKADSGFL